jgi:hypothetical protein
MGQILVQAFRKVHVPDGQGRGMAIVLSEPDSRLDDYHAVLVDMSLADNRFDVIDDLRVAVPETAILLEWTEEEWKAAVDIRDYLARRVSRELPKFPKRQCSFGR